MTYELRAVEAAPELRADDAGAQRLIGHAAVFNSLSDDLGGFRELIKPGAFARSLEGEPDIRALLNHDTARVLGRTRAGTLKLTEDDAGLRVEIEPPDTSYARDLMVSVGRGDITQMSFGFMVRAGGQEWSEDDEGRITRTLTDLELFEVSPVTFPAYPQTDIAARSLEQWRQSALVAPARVIRMRLRQGLAERGITR